MEDYDGDPLDWDTQAGDEQLRRGLKALDTALRCPICQGMLQVPVSLPCGHGFCSGCIRRYQESNTDGCPTCKAHKAQPIPRPYPAVRIDRLLKDAVEAFRPIRSKLLELLGKDEDAPIIIGQSGPAEPADGKRRGSRGSTSSSGSNGDEEGSSSDGSGDGGLLRSHQRRSAWYDRHYAKINYHNADEKSIRAALQTMGLPTHGGKDRLSQRHREFLLAVQTAKDAVTCGSRLPIKSQAQVIKEIMHLEKSRDEENARAAKRAKVGPGAKLPAAREAHLQSLVQKVKRQEQQRRASSSSSLSVSTAGGEEEEEEGQDVTEGREDDWRALDDMQEDQHGEQEEEREPPGKGAAAAAGEDGGGESEPAAAPSATARRGLSNGHASSPTSSSAMCTLGSASRKRASPGADTTRSQSMVMRGRSSSSSAASQHEEDVLDISQDDEEEGRQTTPSSSDTARKRAARWSCEYCTLDNHPELEVCEACGNHRVKSTGHRVQEDQLRIMKEARRISPRGLPTARAGGSR